MDMIEMMDSPAGAEWEWLYTEPEPELELEPEPEPEPEPTNSTASAASCRSQHTAQAASNSLDTNTVGLCSTEFSDRPDK